LTHRLRLSTVRLFTSAALLAVLMGGAAAATVTTLAAPPANTCQAFTSFNALAFTHSTLIDNRFLPLSPGTELTLDGRSSTGGVALPHSVVFTVTDVLKPIDGVYSLVVWDRDISDGVLAEEELAFFAQDRTGNVWNLGEYPEEFENGTFLGAPNTWIGGLAGAIPGIHMQAEPQLATPTYLQGYSPSIKFLDCAQVFDTNLTVCVPIECYADVLVTDETSPLSDPGAHQRKYHAPGVGIIQIGAVNDPEGETLVLAKLRHLNKREMQVARDAALRLDSRAYQNSSIYRKTLPAQPCVPGAASGLACP
jgi:hypothetical protein